MTIVTTELCVVVVAAVKNNNFCKDDSCQLLVVILAPNSNLLKSCASVIIREYLLHRHEYCYCLLLRVAHKQAISITVILPQL